MSRSVFENLVASQVRVMLYAEVLRHLEIQPADFAMLRGYFQLNGRTTDGASLSRCLDVTLQTLRREKKIAFDRTSRQWKLA